MGIKDAHKKEVLSKMHRRTKWAPYWAVLRKFGVGKKIHVSEMTRHKRSWRRTKLKVSPRKMRKSHMG